MSREGYSKTFEFDSPEYFESQDNFEEIDDGVYRGKVRGEEAIVIYNENTEGPDTVDVVGDFSAVRGIQWNHRQELGANKGSNNGVGEHYSPEEPVESERVTKALKEFGVDTQGLEEQEEDVPLASDYKIPPIFHNF